MDVGRGGDSGAAAGCGHLGTFHLSMAEERGKRESGVLGADGHHPLTPKPRPGVLPSTLRWRMALSGQRDAATPPATFAPLSCDPSNHLEPAPEALTQAIG